MKKVLFISYYFPSLGGMGSIRLARFARYLPEFGWQPRVLTVKTVPARLPRDDGLLDSISRDIVINRVDPFDLAAFEKQAGRFRAEILVRGLRRVLQQIPSPFRFHRNRGRFETLRSQSREVQGMHMLFIYPTIHTHVYYQIGVCYLSSVLKAAGHRVSLKFLGTREPESDVVALIRDLHPDLVGFSVVTNQWGYAKEYIKAIKKKVNVPIIVGGIHATVAPEETISTDGVDMICVGEGEGALLELANRMASDEDITDVCNIWLKRGGQVIRNPVRDLIQDVDRIPFPDVELFRRPDDVKVLHLWTSRGCPFSCTYCCNHALRRIFKGKGRYVRLRGLDNVFDEIHTSMQRFPGVEIIHIEDDTFPLFKERVLEFCRRYKEEIAVPFCCNGHVQTIDVDVLKALKEGGCKYIQIGIESGNEWLRKEVLKKGSFSNKQIKDLFKAAKEIGLGTRAFYMLGMPFETERMMDETVALNEVIKPDYPPSVGAFYPFPGTDLYKVCEDQGLLSGRTYDTFRTYKTTLMLPKSIRRHIERTFCALGGSERERYFELTSLKPKYKVAFYVLSAILYLFGEEAFYRAYFAMARVGRFLKKILRARKYPILLLTLAISSGVLRR